MPALESSTRYAVALECAPLLASASTLQVPQTPSSDSHVNVAIGSPASWALKRSEQPSGKASCSSTWTVTNGIPV